MSELLNIDYLMRYAKGKEIDYNKISNILYAEFGIVSSELSLICLYIYKEMEDRNAKSMDD